MTASETRRANLAVPRSARDLGQTVADAIWAWRLADYVSRHAMRAPSNDRNDEKTRRKDYLFVGSGCHKQIPLALLKIRLNVCR
jgi:hypothetical protein